MDVQLYKCELAVLDYLISLQNTKPAGGQSYTPREWSDVTGKFRTEATYIRKDGSIVYLKKTDGSELKVSVEKLSKEDREYLEALEVK